MPIYEYLCSGCRRRFRKLVGMVAGEVSLVCPRCGSTEVSRLISRFSRLRGEDEALDAMADELEGLDENDPKAVRRMMRTLSREMGEDMDEEELEQALLESEEGEAEEAPE
ncbi:MAG TPA: zinc ribbon domain-containing protein [Chthonomonas sp.]|uniref:FmdB family zinc ribbon protein n=1 Tax=Chthonomonas sp. TaxID=2282153 RepID=UPI002B4AF4F2|nr:zinc ribbon domain-containing protein [Chthonomonas sp.]HLI49782.1 zinc ribbon domain-containing protein [Chthonomonas sp.]